MIKIKRIIARAKRRQLLKRKSLKRTASRRVLKSSGKPPQRRSRRIKAYSEEDNIKRIFKDDLDIEVEYIEKTPYKQGYKVDSDEEEYYVFENLYNSMQEEALDKLKDKIDEEDYDEIEEYIDNQQFVEDYVFIGDLDALADDLAKWYMNNDIDLEFPIDSNDYDEVYKEMYAFLDDEGSQFLADIKKLDAIDLIDHDYISIDLSEMELSEVEAEEFLNIKKETTIEDPETFKEYIIYIYN